MNKNSEITAVIPAAGLGLRLRPLTLTMPKVLIPVAGKPILGYILDMVREMGIKKVVVIIGHIGAKIEEFVRTNYDFDASFVEQKEFRGLGHAVNLAAGRVSGQVLIILGDTLIEGDIKRHIDAGYSWIGVKEVENPKRFGVVVEKSDGWIGKLVEKPGEPISRKAIVGIYYLRNSRLLFDSLADLIARDIRTQNEYQLTDALQLMLEKGEKIKSVDIDHWYDCGKVETLLSTNKHLLMKTDQSFRHAPSVVINTPVFIGKNVKMANCVVGPYVSIGNNVDLENVIIQNAIVNDEAVLKNLILTHSVVGQSAVMIGTQQKINLGDNSEIVEGSMGSGLAF